MSDEDYDRCYEQILEKNNADSIVSFLGNGDVALCCWESNPKDCHRSRIAEWLRTKGYEVKEFVDEPQQLSFL